MFYGAPILMTSGNLDTFKRSEVMRYNGSLKALVMGTLITYVHGRPQECFQRGEYFEGTKFEIGGTRINELLIKK